LKEVILNQGLSTIPTHSFGQCTSLFKIEIPSTVTEKGDRGDFTRGDTSKIVENAFHGCGSLGKFRFPTISSHLGAIACHWSEINNEVDEIRVSVENGGAVRRSMRGAIQTTEKES
jgi:hypothetical protein